MIGLAGGVVGAWAVSVIHPQSIETIQQDGALIQRLAAMEQQLSSQTQALVPRADLQRLADRVTGVSDQLGALAEDVERLDKRLASAPAGAAAPAGSGEDLAALRGQVDALATQLKALEPVSARVQELDAAVRSLDPAAVKAAATAAGEANARVSALDSRLQALSGKVNASADDMRLAQLSRALAASDVLAALRAGRSVPPAAALLAGVGGEAGSVQSLMSAATRGAPSLAALHNDFGAVRERLEALDSADRSVLDRLTASASRLVRVRPLDAEGKPAAAAAGSVVRVGDLLVAGDVIGAASAWRELPEPMRQASASFGAALQQRAGVEQAARNALDDALAGLAKAAAAQPAPAESSSGPAAGASAPVRGGGQ